MRRTSLLLAMTALLATGCSFQLGDVEVSQADLEKQVLKTVSADDPTTTAKVSCDGALAGEVGATQDCHATDEAGTTGLHVKATEVDGKDVKFSLAPFIAGDDVAAAIRKLAGEQGIQIDTISCADDLEGEQGAKVACTGTPADSVGDLEVTVTSVEGLRVSFDVQQAG